MKVVYLTSNLNPATPSLDLIWIRHFEINILNYLKTIISYLNRADSVWTDLELSHISVTVHVMLARFSGREEGKSLLFLGPMHVHRRLESHVLLRIYNQLQISTVHQLHASLWRLRHGRQQFFRAYDET